MTPNLDDPESWQPQNTTTPKLDDSESRWPRISTTPNLNDPEFQRPWISTILNLDVPKSRQPRISSTLKLDSPKTRQPQNSTAPNLENPKIQPWKARAKGGRAVIFMIFFWWATAQFTGTKFIHRMIASFSRVLLGRGSNSTVNTKSGACCIVTDCLSC